MTTNKQSALGKKHAAAAKKPKRGPFAGYTKREVLEMLNHRYPNGLPGHELDSRKFSKLIQKDGKTVALFTSDTGSFTLSKTDLRATLPDTGIGYFDGPNYQLNIQLKAALDALVASEPPYKPYIPRGRRPG